MRATVERITAENRVEAEHYLLAHEETAQFLINNLREHGPGRTSHPNSGDFKLVRAAGRVAAVFCLARRGNLLVQSEDDFSELILESCRQEEGRIKGFIGEWHSISSVWLRFKTANPQYKPRLHSKEILYAYLLQDDLRLAHDSRVRLLEESDYAQWHEHSIAYMSELRLPDDLTAEQKRLSFSRMVRNRTAWGLFAGETLLSRAALNSNGPRIGQTGAVFTPVPYRRQGFARAVLGHMLKDCRDIHGHVKNVLFTGEQDVQARRLYESMRYVRIGEFGLILG